MGEGMPKGESKLFTYELRGKTGTVVFPEKITWSEAHRRLVAKFGPEVTLPGYKK